MSYGYIGRILDIDLSSSSVSIQEPPEKFYRMYMGGSGLALACLLQYLPAGVEPLSPENILIISVGVLTGAPISGVSRVMANAKSPLTGAIGDSQGGGFWATEFKRCGYDAIILRGKAPTPVYLWLHDDQVELLDAQPIWGQVTGETEDYIRQAHHDRRIQVLQIGPAGEKLVRYASIMNMSTRACGRTGMGAVMGSKNLKAIAVRRQHREEPLPHLADRGKILELIRWGREHLENSGVWGMHLNGTPNSVIFLQQIGALPTRNWSSGVFEEWENIWGQTMTNTILKKRHTCFGCMVQCKRVVETHTPYETDPRYGGPEYETVASCGSYCGVSDLAAISKANEICNKYGLDTISCGASVSFAMDCYEHGIIDKTDTGGLDLRFGNAAAMVEMVQQIAERRGLGALLGEGVKRAAEQLGPDAAALAVHCKGEEFPAHVPQAKRSLALIYAVNPFGADHMSHDHDPNYATSTDSETLARQSELGLLTPLPERDLSLDKVKFALTTEYVYSLLDCLGTCQFVWGNSWQLYDLNQLVELVRAVTGWRTSLYELMLVGQRRLNMMRCFNAREGFTSADDVLPPKMFVPLSGGATDGVTISHEEFEAARKTYYELAGFDSEGRPTPARLRQLDLDWLVE